MTVQARQPIRAGFLAVILLLVATGVVVAQVPAIETPEPLRPYTSTQDVLKTAGELIDLLASARFEVTGEYTKKDYLSGNCDVEEYHSVFRGYQLMKTVYFVFTSKMERGWYDPNPPGYPIEESLGLMNPKRLTLTRTWNSESIDKVVQLASRLAGLPAPVKADLAAFLRKLLDFKKYHGFLARKPEKLRRIKERVADQCDLQRFNYLEAIEKGQVRDARDRILDRVAAKRELDRCESLSLHNDAKKESEAYRELINGVRDPDSPAISACLDGSYDYYGKTFLGKDGAISKYSTLHPNYYMLRFWERRQSEGTSMLAEFFLSRVLDGLK